MDRKYSQQQLRDRHWLTMFNKLVRFKQTHGHVQVSSAYHDKALAKWVARQRENESVMPAHRRKKLVSIGFNWHSDIKGQMDEKWNRKYLELIAFKKEHGHLMIPAGEKKYHSLKVWAQIQRRKEQTLEPDRRAKLDKIGFRWSGKIKHELNQSWYQWYGQLLSFYNKYGHCRVNSHSQKYSSLGAWVQRQRANWDTLPKLRRKKLEAIEFSTSERIEKEKNKKWIEMFSRLKRFKAKYGHCRVPDRYKDDEVLGRWVSIQRLTEKTLVEWKRIKLTDIGFAWASQIKNDKEKTWYMMLARLERFYKRFGHSSVPENWKGDKQLAIWVAYQRRPKIPLSNDKKQALRDLKFDWHPSVGKRKRSPAGFFMPSV